MHNDLILSAFKKAIATLEEKGVIMPSKSAAAELLSDYIDEEYGFRFGERRLRDYYNATLKEEEIEIKQQAVRDGLSHYLGYSNFEEWHLKTKRLEVRTELIPKNTESGFHFIRHFIKRNRTTFLITLGGLVSFLFINSLNSEKWMEWEENQFMETKFDGHKVENGQIVMFNQSRMESFKKIIPDCDTRFFNVDGNAKLWYGKNSKGELEYFTELGRHPETGKTLRPITKYMIGKYICGSGG